METKKANAQTSAIDTVKQKKRKASLLNAGWLLISLLVALLVLYLLSINPKTQRAFPFVDKIFGSIHKMAVERKALWSDLANSMI